jgi:hypothetical protein
MSVLPQLERDLREAANRRHASSAETLGSRPGVRARARTLRLPLIALVCLLASATIALAASGVILTGAPVRPEGQLNPSVGEGVPAPGASRLLPLRAPDPEGGLPWGMRIVRTTRGEVCVQIGRVDHGQLGELGIDGVFHDDGRFHPLPTDVLPETSRVGVRVGDNDATETVSCQLAGQVTVGVHRGVDRSAGAANGHEGARPLGDLRDIYYGILGKPAVSVSYRVGGTARSIAVLQPLGAYLIVRSTTPGEQVGTGDGSLGSEGDLPPSPPLTSITYRLDGKLCQRGPVEPPGVSDHLADPCPWPHWPTSRYVPPRDLHKPVHVQLRIDSRVVAGAQVSFTAPFAVNSAKEDYEIRIPGISCVRTVVGRGRVAAITGYDVASVGRDVALGATVTHWFSAPALFTGACGFIRRATHVHIRDLNIRHVNRHTATVEVLYRQYEGAVPVLVGRSIVDEPPGMTLAPEPTGGPRHH